MQMIIIVWNHRLVRIIVELVAWIYDLFPKKSCCYLLYSLKLFMLHEFVLKPSSVQFELKEGISYIDGHRVVPARPGGRAAPCHRAGRAVPSPCLVPGVWPKARPAGRRAGPKARWATGPRSCQASSRPNIFFFLFRINKLYFLTGQLGWMDGPTNLHFLFLN